jgi:hypothetical protein
MAVQLQITLPLDWASDFDRVAERWYFFHRPSGFCQYLLPKTGDEITRAGELVPRLPPRPIQSISTKLEAMPICQDKKQSMVTIVEVPQTEAPPLIVDATQVIERKVSVPQQTQQTPLGPGNAPQQSVPGTVPNVAPIRRASGPVARKPLPRQNSAPQQQQQPQVSNCSLIFLLDSPDLRIGVSTAETRFADKPSKLYMSDLDSGKHGTTATSGESSKLHFPGLERGISDPAGSATVCSELTKLRHIPDFDSRSPVAAGSAAAYVNPTKLNVPDVYCRNPSATNRITIYSLEQRITSKSAPEPE